MPYSLILSNKDDPHVAQVLQHATQYPDCTPVLMDTKHALEELSISMRIGDCSSGRIQDIDITDICSIWYRRPVQPKAPSETIDREYRLLAQSEMRALLHNLYRIIPCRILPHPGWNREADHKLFQLRCAQQLGFEVPETYVTNMVEDTHAFFESHDFYCIKALSSYHWYDDQDIEFGLKSAKVSRDELRQAK